MSRQKVGSDSQMLLFVACHVEEDVIVCMLQSALEGVDSVVARFAEQMSKSR